MSERYYDWDEAKNEALKQARGFGFEDVVEAIETGRLLADIAHTSDRYAHQRMIIVDIKGYAIVVPCVRTGNHVFLKTAFASRKATRTYLGRQV